MHKVKEGVLLGYSARKESLSVLRNAVPVRFDREEALAHAERVYVGMRTTWDNHLLEVAQCYVEGDSEAGVIVARWQEVDR